MSIHVLAGTTHMTRVVAGGGNRKLAEAPLGRIGTTSDVAAAVGYLVSEDTGFVTGAVIDVTGGSFMP
jgi:NAD(P)-dependent dehydrogenase (short-subunit alcohol dehydrogenase family)